MNVEPLQRNQPIYTLGEDQTTFCDQSKANLISEKPTKTRNLNEMAHEPAKRL